MGTIWFCLVALMIAMYVLLDGFDLGAGAIHLLVARTDEERRQVLASIGPVWDGNEVWLIAAGGTLYFAFPSLYASGFSGFYLPLMIVLWLLILRGTSIEFRNHIKSAVWDPLWDFLFCASSLLLAIFFGAALANVVRGVPLDSSGYFFEPLWTNFRLGEETGILDWYTILVGLLALFALAMHGGLWIYRKTSGAVSDRAAMLARRAWWAVVALTLLVTSVTFLVQPQVKENFVTWPWGIVFPLLAVSGAAGVKFELARKDDRKAFLASCLYLAGMMASAVFGLYPMVLPARNPVYALTVDGAKAGTYGLRVGLIWWSIGMLLAAVYFTFLYRSFAGKVALDQDSHGYGDS
ncbi:MAG: cytochrome d ubiquinol oxidase subunit II [Acidobacteria bacterium]|nr:cytochrome d ubiquinol oxidase subunit II [Acidobacteriota bacterium]MBS1866826.1 cytochrome d ubiquinol oxidase subunit II [Acidobacteriota bacterium]